MSSQRNWSKAENNRDGLGMQLCPRCCLSCLTGQPLSTPWVETLTDLKVSGFFAPQYLVQIPETIQGNILCLPVPRRILLSPGILRALNPIFVAVANYSQKSLNHKEKVFLRCLSLQHFKPVWEVWTVPVSQCLSQHWICPFVTKWCCRLNFLCSRLIFLTK